MFVIGVLKNGRRFNIERLLAWGIKTMPPICFKVIICKQLKN